MEPCLFRHGKILFEEWQRILARLQWSHVFSDMVSRAGSFDAPARQKGLQWSHVFSDMVRFITELLLQRQECSFNGAMSFQTW